MQICKTFFPFKNKHNYYFIATGKDDSVFHSPNDVARFCYYLNYSCEATEKGNKIWVGQQGEKTNQDPESQLSMMLHSLRKECSSLLCEAVQGKLQRMIVIVILLRIFILFTLLSENRR
jgi:hypothetical protein